MSLSQYVRRILARWRLMAVVTAAVFAAAVVVTLTTPVTYTSSGQLYVASLSDQPDMESVQAAGLHAQGRMLSYAAVASSQEMAVLIGEDLGADALEGATIRTEVPYGTVLINLAVTAPTAEGAQDIAETVAANYNDLLANVEGARATELKVGVSTTNAPSLPTSPSAPKATLNLLAGLLAGLLLAVAAAAVRDLLDTSVRADDDDPGAPVLGRLPRLGSADATLAPGATTPVAEAARRLRLRLEATRHRSFVVAPVDDGDATTVATLIAQSLAQAGRETTLVDADLRAPALAARLGLTGEGGLGAVLRGDTEPDAAITTVEDGLRVLPASPESGAFELVDSAAMSGLLDELRADRHRLLVVAPSLGAVADAAALARRVDAVLLVVRAGHTRQRDLRQALADLDSPHGGEGVGSAATLPPRTEVYLVLTDA